MRFEVDELTRPEVLALIEHHLREAHCNSPPGAVFALDLSGLRDPALTLWTAWEGDALLGMGALKMLDAGRAEVKSMRTVVAAQRRGVGRAMLDHLIAQARARGVRMLLLETGANDAFAAARALYEGAGFRPCAAFGDYTLTNFNRCYALVL